MATKKDAESEVVMAKIMMLNSTTRLINQPPGMEASRVYTPVSGFVCTFSQSGAMPFISAKAAEPPQMENQSIASSMGTRITPNMNSLRVRPFEILAMKPPQKGM